MGLGARTPLTWSRNLGSSFHWFAGLWAIGQYGRSGLRAGTIASARARDARHGRCPPEYGIVRLRARHEWYVVEVFGRGGRAGSCDASPTAQLLSEWHL